MPIAPEGATADPVPLHPRFRGQERYQSDAYRLLPLRFARLDGIRSVVTNLVGDHLVLPTDTVHRLIAHQLRPDDPGYLDCQSALLLATGPESAALDLLALRFGRHQERLADFTTLHLFVVTLRCDHSCGYCQVSRVSEDRTAFDMDAATADRAVDLMFEGPSRQLKVEFQGGEPLLNWSIIQRVVERVEERNRTEGRDIAFVIATNLSQLSGAILAYCLQHRISLSTSLDGPEDLHNTNRPRAGQDSHACAVRGIQCARAVLGQDQVSALMTTTQRTIEQPEAVIDEYLRLGFREVFLRWLSPFGFARRSARTLGYTTATWLAFYERGLRYILTKAAEGVPIRETFASIILRKMLHGNAGGYVDLASPTAIGIGVAVWNYNGDVYASDEARMLAETGDTRFRLGNVHQQTFADLFGQQALQDWVRDTAIEGIPGCSDCPYAPWCGTDPVFHVATQGDLVGHRPTSAFCQRNMGIFSLLVRMLTDEPATARILRSWV